MLLRGASALFVFMMVGRAVPAADLAPIEAYVQQKMSDHLIPGLALAVIHDGALTHQRGFGELAAASPVVIGSLSKALTATAVLQLVDAGKVALDAPARQYVPEFALADPAAQQITVRHLLNQTSGLPEGAPRAESRDASLADHVKALREVRLAAVPGAQHIYASPNYQVLGRLVEVVSGEPFGAYVQRHIFDPLRMTSSSADPARDVAPGHNVWWGFSGPTAYRWEPGRLPTASLRSSAPDLARFLRAHLNGGELDGARILSPLSVQTAQRGVGKALGFAYAMGFREGTTAGVPSLWHGGALPSYRGAMVMIPATRSGVVVLANSSSMFTDHTREIAAGVVALMNGRPTPTGVRPLKRTYLFIAMASLVLLALGARGLWRAVRGPRLARNRGLWSVASDLSVPVVLIALVPRLAQVSWRGMLESAPDIVVTAAVLIVMSLASGAAKLSRREREPA